MNDTVVVLSAVSAIVAGTPILLAALGELIAERSGVMNLGVEGMMLLGAVVGFWTGVHTGSLTLSLLAGGAAGALLACVHGLLAVSLRVNQTVSGLSLVIVGTGLSAFLGSAGGSPLVEAPNGVDVHPLLPSALRDIPVVGPILLGQDAVVYASWILVAIVGYVLYRTSAGLSLRAIGEDPAAADAAGLNVTRPGTRRPHSGIRCRIGRDVPLPRRAGHLAERTDGRGRVDRVALVILAGWRPWLALVGAYAFGALRGLGFTLQIAQVSVPADFLNMIPFIATYLVVIVVSANPSRAAGRRPGRARPAVLPRIAVTAQRAPHRSPLCWLHRPDLEPVPDIGKSVTLDLDAGRTYAYRFWIDGDRWENDWRADAYAPNEFGGDDSILDLTDGSHRVTALQPAEPAEP